MIPTSVEKYVYYREPGIVLLHGDCLEILPLFEPDSVDLVLTDPPYGIKITKGTNTMGSSPQTGRQGTDDTWDNQTITDAHLGNIYRVSDEQILFGANYYWGLSLHNTSCYIVWDKRGDMPDVPFMDMELAWTSFDKRQPKKYTVINHGFIRADKEKPQHPTQKPLTLFKLILQDFKGDLILDPFLGSGTTAVAAKQLGRKCIGIELESKYLDIAIERLRQEVLF